MEVLILVAACRVTSVRNARALLGFLACRPSRRATILTLIGQFLIIAKLEDHDIRG
jgi:hypothetical protein